MTRTPIASPRPAQWVAAMALAGAAALAAAATTPGTRATPSPDQPAARNGDYEVLQIGETMIRAKCREGGWVFVAAHPAPGAAASAPRGHSRTLGISDERDAAIRSACQAVDFSK